MAQQAWMAYERHQSEFNRVKTWFFRERYGRLVSPYRLNSDAAARSSEEAWALNLAEYTWFRNFGPCTRVIDTVFGCIERWAAARASLL
jgi:hypothetical protein